MCTASWSFQPGGYNLIFNRDEQRSRPRALNPEVGVRNGGLIVAPKDPKGGGTWILVNSRGLSVCILNHYYADANSVPPARSLSRGLIPYEFAACETASQAFAEAMRLDLKSYRPFHLLLIDGTGEAKVMTWDGIAPKDTILTKSCITTSSYRSEEIQSYRLERYSEIVGEGDAMHEFDRQMSFHCDASHQDLAYNPFMSREDAETQCLCIIRVDASIVSFEYRDRVSNKNAFRRPLTTELERAS